MVLGNQFHRLPAIVGFGYDFEIRLLFQKKFDTGSDERVVVGEEDAYLCQNRSLDGRITQLRSRTVTPVAAPTIA
jgi:hypothetical protein